MSLINAMISPVTFGLFEVAFDLCFQKRRASLTVPPQKGLWLDDQERLPPEPRRSCQKHHEASIPVLATWDICSGKITVNAREHTCTGCK
jgi:hypothetical protein